MKFDNACNVQNVLFFSTIVCIITSTISRLQENAT